ncbi:unnamed protein product [Heterosigma akashiwo]
MKLLMVWPVIQTLGVLVFLIPWTIYALYLASSGEVTVDSTGTIKTFTYDDNIRYAGLYLLFCWFWTSQFIIAMGQVVVAMAISFWYFTLDRSKIGNGTVLKAIRQSMWYHMGTAAFGSLIIAIIKTIRAIIAYLQKKHRNWMRTLKDCATGGSNPAGCALLYPVLHVVPGKVHEISQQKRIHPDRHLRQELLLRSQGGVLPDCAEHPAHRRRVHGGRLRAAAGQDPDPRGHHLPGVPGAGLRLLGQPPRPVHAVRLRLPAGLLCGAHVRGGVWHGHQHLPAVLRRRRGDGRALHQPGPGQGHQRDQRGGEAEQGRGGGRRAGSGQRRWRGEPALMMHFDMCCCWWWSNETAGRIIFIAPDTTS